MAGKLMVAKLQLYVRLIQDVLSVYAANILGFSNYPAPFLPIKIESIYSWL